MLRSLAERLGGIIPSGAAKSKRRDGASSATDYASIPTQEKTEPPPPADPSRPLSATEAAFVYLRMSMVTVAALSGPIDAALIGKAIELLRQKHPYLSLALVPDFFAPGHLRFVVARDALLDYRIVPVEDPSRTWQSMVEEEVTMQWEWSAARLPWRLTLLAPPDLGRSGERASVLVWTHSACISDAVGGTVFMHELLSLHAAMAKALIPEKFELPPLPSVVAMVGADSTLAEEVVLRAAYPVAKYQISHPILRLNAAGPAPLPAPAPGPAAIAAAVAPEKPRRSSFLFASVPAERMQVLQKRCKAAHVSVGSFLSTALVFANFRQLWRHGHASTVKPTKLELTFHVNMRPRLLTPRETQDIAYFVSALPAEWTFSPAITFWEAAMQVHAGTRTQLDRSPLYVMMLDWLLSFPERSVLQTLTSGRTGEIAISNLGAYPWSTEYDAVRLQSLWCAHSTAAFGAVHTLCTSTAESGAFSWVFDEAVARREDAEEMLSDVIRLVERPPDAQFGMLDWLASTVREKEGLPVLSLSTLGGAALDKALQAQEDAPQASTGYRPLNSDPPSGALVSDPNLIDESEELGPFVAPPPIAPPAAAAQAPAVPERVAASPSEEMGGDAANKPPPSPSPLSHSGSANESLEAIEL